MRACKVCGAEKTLDEFRLVKNRHGNAYRMGTCRECERAATRSRMAGIRAADPWYAWRINKAHRERNRAAYLQKRAVHDEAWRRRAGHKPAMRRPKIDKEMAAFDAKHVRALRHIANGTMPKDGWTGREWAAWNQRNNPRFAVNQRMRNAIRKALRGGKKGRGWESLVGYTLDELAAHMQRQMPRGYSMKDFGTGRLHIDHIVPKRLFDVTDAEQLRACWALPNLRPVPAVVNLRKGGRRVTLV